MNTLESATAYYIDPKNGSDNNPGTFDRPFSSIQQGIDVAGETENDSNQIYLKGGTYNLTEAIEIDRYSGEEDAFLTIQALPGEEVILDGSQVDSSGGLINIRNVRRVNIIGLEVRNAPSHGIEVVNGKYISIVDNLIHHTQGMGIRVRGYLGGDLTYEADSTVQSSDVVIDNNEVYLTNLSNSGDNKGLDNWGAGIQAWNADDVTIINNTVGSNYGEGISLNLVDDGIVANNVVYDSFSVQIYLDNATDSIVENNFIYSTGDRLFDRGNRSAYGIALANEIYNISDPKRFYLDDNLIQHNVIVGADTGIIYGTWAGIHQDEVTSNPQGLRNSTISRNTVYGSESYSINFDADPNHENVTISDNIFYQESEFDLSQIDSFTGLNFRSNLWFGGDTGDATSSSDIRADPLLVNPGGTEITDYQLQINSPAIDVLTGDRNYEIS
ncbi:MAG: right-handed parallel beta-helix repeat-containing protein, partial [Cyanobacteria bacterium P01_G01_bin.67]